MKHQLSILARIFARNANYKAIILTRSELCLVGKDSLPLNINYMKINEGSHIVTGYLWSEVCVEVFGGSQLILGGISKAEVNEIHSTLTHLVHRYQKKFFSSLQPRVTQAYSDANPILRSNSYIRHQIFLQWQESHQALEKSISHPAINDHLTREQQKYLNAIKPLVVDGSQVVKNQNNTFIENKLEQFKSFFDTVESQPLTYNQRKACVINEKYNLVLAGAGTGKTSTMVGRAGYLIHAGLAQPEQILMLAFGNDAAKEMRGRIEEKIQMDELSAKTFHSFGKEIITHVEGVVPSINKMAEDERLKTHFVDEQFKRLMLNKEYQSLLITYFIRFAYPYKNPFNFKNLGEYNKYIRENDIRTLQGELVKSYEECEIANFLFQQGITYQYEANYQVNTSGPDFRVYQPDFYLPEEDIYIEHFGVDENNRTPPFIDQAKYIEGMRWKRQLHEKHQTKLIETYSYQKRQGNLTQLLGVALVEAQVVFNPVPNDELLSTLEEFGQVSAFSHLLSQLLTLIKSSLLSIKQFISKADQHDDKERMLAAAHLFDPIYSAYQQHLIETDTIDFDDMIAKAITHIESHRYISPFTHILVDEFQDISAGRARMIKALLAQYSDSTLFCVGDDWQAIYQFTGSDVSITKNFEQHFGKAATSMLDQTFRFNNKIGEVAAKFISQNPAQIQKKIQSYHNVDHAAVSLLKTSDNQAGVSAALSLINAREDEKASVLILVRFKHDKPDITQLKRSHANLDIKVMTAHAAKGKEADYVIVLGLQKGKFGFPSEKTSHPLLEILLPQSEPYPYAEERRLFYVALTRAKHHVYLVSDANKASEFIRELIKDKYDVIHEQPAGYDFQTKIADIPCSQCKSGYMVARDGKFGRFYGCSDFPLCNNKQSACEWCKSGLIERGGFRICENTVCKYVEPICPKCNGKMKLRTGPHGKFWGCSNFRKDSEFTCRHSDSYIDLSTASRG